MADHQAMDLLAAVEELEELTERYREIVHRREYVRKEHVPFLDARLRTFKEYLAVCGPRNFTHYTRLKPAEFERIFGRIAGVLQHPINHASPISGRQRLCIFLRHVGHGYDFGSLAEEMHCGKSTVRAIVYEVASAIINEFFAEAFPPFTRRELEEIAIKTQQRCDYPRAVGFLDGKHIAIRKPANSGSTYFNYKKFFSIILLALVDCDNRILAFDLGAPGRVGDAGVFLRSNIKRFFDRNDDIFPPTRQLGAIGPVQYHILVDCGFGQGLRYVRPYSQIAADASASKRRFNFKYSCARRMVENTFGLLCKRFTILRNEIQMEPRNAVKVVTALLVLHNLLRRRRHVLSNVIRFPPPVQLPLIIEEEALGQGVGAAELARERIRVTLVTVMALFTNGE